MRKTTIIILCLILLVVSVNAFEDVESSSGGLTITYPKNEYFIQDKDISLRFQVFNSSNLLLDNSQVNCSIKILNNTGHYFLDTSLNFHNDYFYYNLSKQDSGIYPVYVYCNNSEAGFISFDIHISNQGRINIIPESNIAIIIFLPLVLSLIFLVGSAVLGKDHTALKIFLFILSIPPFFASMHLALLSIIKFYNFPQLQEAVGTITYWSTLLFVAIFTYFLIYFIYKAFQYMGQKKKERLEY